ncbi:MAG: hypothetical protein IJX59_02045 [Clostridia bacterium]|nr:hypothetical protein [Clostridia bacterium]
MESDQLFKKKRGRFGICKAPVLKSAPLFIKKQGGLPASFAQCLWFDRFLLKMPKKRQKRFSILARYHIAKGQELCYNTVTRKNGHDAQAFGGI